MLEPWNRCFVLLFLLSSFFPVISLASLSDALLLIFILTAPPAFGSDYTRVELTRGVENDASFKYESGNDEPHRGFGHICVTVDNLEAACKRFDEMGVKFKKRPEEGKMRVNLARVGG